jgi:hypothetical protein
VVAQEGKRDVLDPQVPAEHGYQRHQHDGAKLRAGTQAANIVVQPDESHEAGADQHPRVRAVDVDPDGRGHEDRDHDGHAADPWDRPGMDARTVAAVVDSADLRRDPRDQGRKDQDERRGGQEAPRNPVIDQPADGIPERHGVHSLEAGSAGIAERRGAQ